MAEVYVVVSKGEKKVKEAGFRTRKKLHGRCFLRRSSKS